MNRVYLAGYSGLQPHELKELVDSLGADLVDIRFRAGSRNPAWNKGKMQLFFGPSYWHCRELGNVNYRNGGPIKLAEPEKATEHLAEILKKRPVVLLCACREAYTCHRWEAGRMLKRELGVEVVNLSWNDVKVLELHQQMSLFDEEE
jgi:uncharacterized protein (DUF488 family)